MDSNELRKPKGYFRRTKKEILMGLTVDQARKHREQQKQKLMM